MNRWCGFVTLCLLSACGSNPPAPVLDRSPVSSGTGEIAVLEPDGQYRVRRGDSLWMIAFHFGLDHRELARWNGISAPFVIHPGQLLRLSAPVGAGSGAVTRPAATPSARDRQVEVRPAAPPRTPAEPPVQSSTVTPDTTPPPREPTRPATPVAGLEWQWPANGRVIRGFVPGDAARNGYDIGGTLGDKVVAAAQGQVVYSGNGLIGYGELIIIKHNDRLLSAYAHNRRRLVDEGDQVTAGQLIAELGQNGRNETLLHFEIRREGRPVDPAEYLPSR